MPTYGTTAKHALRWLRGSNVFADIDAGFQALAEDLDGLIATAASGLLSARPTSTGGSPGKSGRWFYATDTAQLFFDYGTGWIDAPGRPTIVTALPTTNLYDGQIVHFQNAAMATDGILWSFRYRAASASTYKWECIGGRPLVGYEGSTGTASSPVSYSDLSPAAIGPDITFPFAGEYDWEVSVHTQYLSVASGSPGTPRPQLLMREQATGIPFFALLSTSLPLLLRYNCIAGAGRETVLAGLYRMNFAVPRSGTGAANVGFFWRTIRVTPARVI